MTSLAKNAKITGFKVGTTLRCRKIIKNEQL